MHAIQRIAAEVRRRNAAFVVVSGDLFDSITPFNSTVSAACSAIGELPVPVFLIPGNHDHGGPGSVWHQPFFRREQQQLAPNLKVLLTSEPVELDSAVLFPCPLLRRHETADPTACLRALPNIDQFGSKVRIVVAHGSTVDFGETLADDEDFSATAVNVIDVLRLSDEDFDYVALGDWHGAKQITDKAWYAGTPEPDRFPKGTDHAQGHILAVQANRGGLPLVEQIPIATMAWRELSFTFGEVNDPARLAGEVERAIGTGANKALLRLHLAGVVAIEESGALDRLIESWQARFIRLKLEDSVVIAPSDAELRSLTTRAEDPLIARVAARLAQTIAEGSPEAVAAQSALRELYLATSSA